MLLGSGPWKAISPSHTLVLEAEAAASQHLVQTRAFHLIGMHRKSYSLVTDLNDFGLLANWDLHITGYLQAGGGVGWDSSDSDSYGCLTRAQTQRQRPNPKAVGCAI